MRTGDAYLPTPREIELAAAAIRAEWSDEEYRRRSNWVENRRGRPPALADDSWTPPIVRTPDLERE